MTEWEDNRRDKDIAGVNGGLLYLAMTLNNKGLLAENEFEAVCRWLGVQVSLEEDKEGAERGK